MRLRRVRLRDEGGFSVAFRNGSQWVPVVPALARYRAERGGDLQGLAGVARDVVAFCAELEGIRAEVNGLLEFVRQENLELASTFHPDLVIRSGTTIHGPHCWLTAAKGCSVAICKHRLDLPILAPALGDHQTDRTQSGEEKGGQRENSLCFHGHSTIQEESTDSEARQGYGHDYDEDERTFVTTRE